MEVDVINRGIGNMVCMKCKSDIYTIKHTITDGRTGDHTVCILTCFCHSQGCSDGLPDYWVKLTGGH